MLVVFGKPISWLMQQLTDALNSMSGANAVLLGVHPRPDDGVRHGWPAEQGRLQLRRRRCRRRGSRCPPTLPS